MKLIGSVVVLACVTTLPLTASFFAGQSRMMGAPLLSRTTAPLPLDMASSADGELSPPSNKKKAALCKKKKKKGFTINEKIVGKVVSSEGIFEGRESIERPESTLGVTREQLYS
jgi:hypothetical protein